MLYQRDLQAFETALEPAFEMTSDYQSHMQGHEIPWNKPWCFIWTRFAMDIAREALAGSGIEVSRVVSSNPSYHEYFSLSFARCEPIVVDGTWQQFIPNHSPAYQDSEFTPRILLGRVSSLRPILESGHIPNRKHAIWQPNLHKAYKS